MSRRLRLSIVVPALLALTVIGTYLADADDETSSQLQPIAAGATAADPTSSVSELLGSVRTVDHLQKVEGYDRSCKKGHGCVFGPAWTDDSTAPGSHNGCDTRNDVLAAQLVGVRFRPGSRDCKVTAGVLHDPYTGTTIDDLGEIQIDHVYPLARAWNAGAWAWPIDRRTAFANDLDSNLLAVDGRTNQQKSDKGIDTWLPPSKEGQCRYITAYLTVATQYGLNITTSDAAVATTVCTGRP